MKTPRRRTAGTPVSVRFPSDIQDRVKALAMNTDLTECAILRALVMVALPMAEQDPGLIVKAPALCRNSVILSETAARRLKDMTRDKRSMERAFLDAVGASDLPDEAVLLSCLQ